jgi:myosin heavy subunit
VVKATILVEYRNTNYTDEILVLKKERDDAIKASERRRQEMQQSQDKNTNISIENDKLKKELIRLKKTAEEMMHSHNEDLLHFQEREKDTLNELSRAETRLKNLQFSDQSEGRQAQLKVDSLNEEVRILRRDKSILEKNVSDVKALEIQHQQQSQTFKHFLENLQQSQQTQFEEQIEKHNKQVKKLKEEIKSINFEKDEIKKKMENHENSLENTNKLQKEIDNKNKKINRLTQIIGEQRNEFVHLQEHQQKLQKQLNKEREGLIELPLIKNLIVQFISMTKAEQKEPVLRLMGQVLKFSVNELDEILTIAGCKAKGWFGGWLSNPTPQHSISVAASLKELPKSPNRNNSGNSGSLNSSFNSQNGQNNSSKDLSDMFIAFLENESNLRQSNMQFPANEMAAAYISKNNNEDKQPLGVTDMSLLNNSANSIKDDVSNNSSNSFNSRERYKPSLIPFPANSTRNEISANEEPIVLSSMSGGISTVLPSVQSKKETKSVTRRSLLFN